MLRDRRLAIIIDVILNNDNSVGRYCTIVFNIVDVKFYFTKTCILGRRKPKTVLTRYFYVLTKRPRRSFPEIINFVVFRRTKTVGRYATFDASNVGHAYYR